jgi:hypothetical protein
MWQVSPEDDYCRCHKWYEKKRSRELKAVLTNLDTFLTALQSGAKVQQIKVGFLHPEPCGVLAIDQRGAKGSLAETRLYVFPDDDTETLHLLTIGDKNSQAADIQRCKEFVEGLRRHKAKQNPLSSPESAIHDYDHEEEVQQRNRDGP